LTAKIVFGDESTLHLLGNVNRYNLKIWEQQSSYSNYTCERERLKCFNAFCVSSKQNLFGPPFFAEHTVTGIVEEFLMPILEEQDCGDMLFQHDGLPPHLHKEVMDF
jgi:hypothetical protein